MSESPVCAIIGAGPGVSRSVARRFGRDGYRFALFSRGGAADEAAALTAEGFSASGTALDASDPDAVRQAMVSTSPVSVLVYNATAASPASPLNLSWQQLQRDLTISAVSALVAAQAVAPGMQAAGGGSILLTGGGFAHRPMAALASLGMGKAALRNLAFSLAEELRPSGIRVGTVTILGVVAPGTPINPDAIAEAFHALHADREWALGVETGFSGT